MDGQKDVTSIYIRMNADPEKDYNFTIPKDWKVKDLFRLFNTIPVVMSPYYFFDPVPEGFGVSVHPGYLTAEGSMLFTSHADDKKYVKPLDLEGLLSDQVLDEMLIVPIFHFNYSRYITVISLLLGWLYLDLPEHWTPTPGVAPTTIIVKLLQSYVPFLKDEAGLSGEAFDSNNWRYLFFTLHIIKVLFIFLLFRIGVINPRSFNPNKKKEGPTVEKLTPEALRAIGWTGLRRACPEDFVDKHRDFKIENAGGLVKAHMKGLLDYKDGIYLEDGEGWSVYKNGTPKELLKVDSKLVNVEDKFIVSQQYLDVVADHAFKQWQVLSAEQPEKVERYTKELIRFGFMDGPEKLVELYRSIHDKRFPKKKA